jgi:hypothetical protein
MFSEVVQGQVTVPAEVPESDHPAHRDQGVSADRWSEAHEVGSFPVLCQSRPERVSQERERNTACQEINLAGQGPIICGFLSGGGGSPVQPGQEQGRVRSWIGFGRRVSCVPLGTPRCIRREISTGGGLRGNVPQAATLGGWVDASADAFVPLWAS